MIYCRLLPKYICKLLRRLRTAHVCSYCTLIPSYRQVLSLAYTHFTIQYLL